MVRPNKTRYEGNIKHQASKHQIGVDKQTGAKVYKLLESDLQQLLEKSVYQHRNHCAHDTLSYQNDKPALCILAEDNGKNNSYFY